MATEAAQGGGQGGTTRLDGLMGLLDTGTNMSVRRMAATQIGELVAAHPSEVRPVLRRVRKLLRSSNWDTRVAAGHALASIASLTPRFVPLQSNDTSSVKVDEVKEESEGSEEYSGGNGIQEGQTSDCIGNLAPVGEWSRPKDSPSFAPDVPLESRSLNNNDTFKLEDSLDVEGEWQSGLRLDRLDLIRIMASGALLFGSSGEEYQGVERDVTQQRARLKADLGLDDSITGGNDILNITDNDLAAEPTIPLAIDANKSPCVDGPTMPVERLVEDISAANLSARERNRLKREAKKRARLSGPQAHDQSTSKRPRSNGDNQALLDQQQQIEPVPLDGQDEFEEIYSSQYSDFQPTCEVLKRSLLEPRWETRHGAAIGLRHILAVHANSIGRHSYDCRTADQENSRWLEDISCRLLCVLTMDRFGDFVGDAVVAPVRETAAMALAAASRFMSNDRVVALLTHLLTLLHSSQARSHWEVRHALLLGVRYILAVQVDRDNVDALIIFAFPPVAECLRDDDDDVRAVAAEALSPISKSITSSVPDQVPVLVATLWDSLLDIDDISASTGSILRLLTQILRIPAPEHLPYMWLDIKVFDDLSDIEGEDSSIAGGSCRKDTEACLHGTFRTHPLVHLVPRLWPFLRHGAVSVRLAAISLVDTLASVEDERSRNETMQWFRSLCGEVFERLFRNILLENVPSVLQHTKRVWTLLLSSFSSCSEDMALVVESTAPLLSHWLRAASHETRADAAAFDSSRNKSSAEVLRRRRSAAAARRAAKARAAKHSNVRNVLLGHEMEGSAPVVEGPYEGVAMQLNVCDALGHLAAIWPKNDDRFVTIVVESMKSPLATARRLACDICRSWSQWGHNVFYPQKLRDQILAEMEGRGNCPYGEIGAIAGGFFSDTTTLLEYVGAVLGAVVHVRSLCNACEQGRNALKVNDFVTAALSARALHSQVSSAITGSTWALWEQHVHSNTIPRRQLELISAVRQRILTALGYMSVRLEELSTSLCASASSALVKAFGEELPAKVGSYIKSLTASSRTSQVPYFQQVAADGLAALAVRLSARGSNKPLTVLLKNLTKHLTALPISKVDSIIVLSDQTYCFGTCSRDGNSSNWTSSSAQGGPSRLNLAGLNDTRLDPVEVTYRGAALTFHAFCSQFGPDLFRGLPTLWDSIDKGLRDDHAKIREDGGNVLAEAMTILMTVVGKLDESLHPGVGKLFPFVIKYCASRDSNVSNIAVRCLADMVAAIPGDGMHNVVHLLIPMLSGSENAGKDVALCGRQGAARALKAVVDRMGSSLIPYAAFLIVPIMMRMVDEDAVVRDSASGVFGILVRMMPLEGGAPDDPHMSATMSVERAEARQFLGQLLGTHPRMHYELPVPIAGEVTLRKYQQECLDWLAFLNRYGLHGALCDDMGLGKTLMTLCIIAGDRASMISSNSSDETLCPAVCPSLVVCPSTIAAHWVQECQRFFPSALNPVLLYTGSPKTRHRIRTDISFASAALVVTSYEVLSNDLQFFGGIRWNYVALDEGHVIKNSKTRVARAVRALSPLHRLVLTGTPIQNSVLELWSLFDFLMPGYLGTESSFKETYAKPILASRSTDCSESDREQGIVATEALHRQVLPFILRRLKDDVLAELPPKIIQDYICNMTPLQIELYEDFAQDMAKNEHCALSSRDSVNGKQSEKSGSGSGSHVFRVLSYLRRLCSHPKLVLTEHHPEHARIMKRLASQGQSLNDISASSKLMGLRDILTESGIGDPETSGRASGGHRALIFAQLKQMLDLVESDLFKILMPQVTYMRLDGSVESSKRQAVVTRFNADPTIDCLLLTTNVGGLGLNLVGADTVIFLEHDWNPTKDLQAMDRAHRMGQKRTVNVYRLITRGTLEEKIMSMQKFKTHIANTVVNRENSSLQTMNTETLLSLFKVEGDPVAGNDDGRENAKTQSGGKGMKEALANVGDLWEESQYEEEFNMTDFLSVLQSNDLSDIA